MNFKHFKSSGFSLVEVLVSVGLLSAVGLGMVALNSQQKKALSGIRNSGDMNKVMTDLRTILGDTEACKNNFDSAIINGGSISVLKDANGHPVLKVGETVANNSYTLKSITVEDHDSYAQRTRILLTFSAESDSIRSKTLARSFNIFTRVDSGKIVECLDPLKLTAEGALKKMCFDVDPLKEGDCEKNYDHLLEEVKMLYCQNHPYLEYNPATKKCLPLDANKQCDPGRVMAGYQQTGKKLHCVNFPSPTYPPVDTNAGPNPTPKLPCSSWSTWTPDVSSVCLGTPVAQTRSCLDGGSTETESQLSSGSKSDGSCCDQWSPLADNTCSNEKLTQTNNCGQTRVVDGTKTCSGGDCKYKHPIIWQDNNTNDPSCVEWFANDPSDFTEETIENGGTRYMTAKYCVSNKYGNCHGSFVIKCEDGTIKEISRDCTPGYPP